MNETSDNLSEEKDDIEEPIVSDIETEANEENANSIEDQIALLQSKVDENWDKYLRASAELENVRKRASRDVENAHKYAIERFASDLLDVFDSLEMAINNTQEDTEIEVLKDGTIATLKLLDSVFQRFGVEEINPTGESFDPERHEAMMMQSSEDHSDGAIINVYQKGYSLNGRLLRPARVIVSGETEG